MYEINDIMDKLILGIGIILVVLSFFIGSAVISPGILNQQGLNNTYINKITIHQNSTVTDNVDIANASLFVVSYQSTLPIQFYLINQNLSKNFTNKNITISSINKTGVYVVIYNSTLGTTFPYNQNLSEAGYSKPAYIYNGTQVSQNGTVYQKGNYSLEFYNQNKTNYANVTYHYYIYQLSNLSRIENYTNTLVPGSIVTSIIFIVGLVLIVLGIVRKKVPKDFENNFDKEVNRLYNNLDSKKNTKKTKNKIR